MTRRLIAALVVLILLAVCGKPALRAARDFWRGYTGNTTGWYWR